MNIKKARDTGFIGSFTPVMVYDIRDDGYLTTTPVMMRSLSHEWDHFEIVHLEAETDAHWDQPYLCIDIRKENY